MQHPSGDGRCWVESDIGHPGGLLEHQRDRLPDWWSARGLKDDARSALGIQLGVPSLTGDDILIAVRGVTSPQSHPDLHRVGTPGHTIYFTESSPESLMQDLLAQHEAVWPAFERVARKRARIGQPTVIDYWGLLPERMAAFGEENVESFSLHIDPDIPRARELLNEGFLSRSSDRECMFDNFMSLNLRRNKKIHTEATALGLPILHQDGTTSVNSLVNEVLSADR